MLQRLSIALAQVKVGNTKQNQTNYYILYVEQKKLPKNNITI